MGFAQSVEPALDGRSHGTFDQPPHEDEVQRRLSQLDVHPGLSKSYSFNLSTWKKAERAFCLRLFLFVAVGCGRSHLKYPRLSFPADRATSRRREVALSAGKDRRGYFRWLLPQPTATNRKRRRQKARSAFFHVDKLKEYDLLRPGWTSS